MLRPEGYRSWIYVGTPLTPNSLNPPEAPFPEFHNVYVDPASFETWSQTGSWPEGTLIVKELVLVGQEQAVSGKGYFQGDFVGLEAAVKSAARFPDEPGNWAYFSWGHDYPLAETAAPFETAQCNSCHQASADDDFVFTQFYPVLRAAKPGGRAATETTRAAALPPAASASAMGADGELEVPTQEGPLLEWLRAGSYASWAKEGEAHPGRGPHTEQGLPVRVFINAELEGSLAAGAAQHPRGAAAVKEMYSAAGELAGWAVMVKTERDAAGGAGWWWYEVTGTAADTAPVAAGAGLGMCTGCHGPGNDFILTGFPLQ